MIGIQLLPRNAAALLQRARRPLSEPFGGVAGSRARAALVEAQTEAFDGVSGPPLSRSYAERKAIEAPGAPLGVSTGRLRASMLGRGPSTELRVEDSELRLGSSLRYAEVVNEQRPFLVPGPEALAAIERAVGPELERSMADATGGLLERD